MAGSNECPESRNIVRGKSHRCASPEDHASLQKATSSKIGRTVDQSFGWMGGNRRSLPVHFQCRGTVLRLEKMGSSPWATCEEYKYKQETCQSCPSHEARTRC